MQTYAEGKNAAIPYYVMSSISTVRNLQVLLPAFAVVALAVECGKPDFVSSPGVLTAVAFNSSEYQDRGFLITPQRFRGEYNSVGQITLSIAPAVEENATAGIASDNAAESDSLYSDGLFVIERITTDCLVE